MSDETSHVQEERRELARAIAELAHAHELTSSGLERLESTYDFALQREALLPTRKGECPYFRIGRAVDDPEGAEIVPASPARTATPSSSGTRSRARSTS